MTSSEQTEPVQTSSSWLFYYQQKLKYALKLGMYTAACRAVNSLTSVGWKFSDVAAYLYYLFGEDRHGLCEFVTYVSSNGLRDALFDYHPLYESAQNQGFTLVGQSIVKLALEFNYDGKLEALEAVWSKLMSSALWYNLRDDLEHFKTDCLLWTTKSDEESLRRLAYYELGRRSHKHLVQALDDKSYDIRYMAAEQLDQPKYWKKMFDTYASPEKMGRAIIGVAAGGDKPFLNANLAKLVNNLPEYGKDHAAVLEMDFVAASCLAVAKECAKQKLKVYRLVDDLMLWNAAYGCDCFMDLRWIAWKQLSRRGFTFLNPYDVARQNGMHKHVFGVEFNLEVGET